MGTLYGCGTALVTPFKHDGSVDEQTLAALVEWQIASGIDFLVPCGTTGETPTLSHDEWLRVVSLTAEVARGRVPVIAGASSNCTADAVAKTKEVCAIPGVTHVLSSSPYYNKPTQEGQYQHFKAVAEASLKPVVIYSVMGRTGVNIEVDTLARLSKLPNVAAVKEASGRITQIAELCGTIPAPFAVLSGDDALTLPLIAVGGQGLISVASNVIPQQMAEMTHAALQNDWTKARQIYHQYLALMMAHFIESNPIPVKAVMAMMGKIEETYRLPMCPMQPQLREKLATIARAAGVIH